MDAESHFRCLKGCTTYPLEQAVHSCGTCRGPLEVVHPVDFLSTKGRDPWKNVFSRRQAGMAAPYGSGVWRYHEWVLPNVPDAHLVSLGEGGSALTRLFRLGDAWGIELHIKQCGHSLSGSIEDLGMTVLVSQVNHMRRTHREVPALACATSGVAAAALAAYGAAAGIRTLALLPRSKLNAAEMLMPLANGARVIAINADSDGCMAHFQRLADEEGVYLVNPKNALLMEGQKTVSLEITQGLGWTLPDWVSIPGANLAQTAAVGLGFRNLRDAKITSGLPRLLCAQAESAPSYRSFNEGAATARAVATRPPPAAPMRFANPAAFPQAYQALQETNGVMVPVGEGEVAEASRVVDQQGLYTCPHTAAALAGVKKRIDDGLISRGSRVVVLSVTHGLRFNDFKAALTEDRVEGAWLGSQSVPIEVANDYAAVKDAALG